MALHGVQYRTHQSRTDYASSLRLRQVIRRREIDAVDAWRVSQRLNAQNASQRQTALLNGLLAIATMADHL
jgi:hypothetical protein